MATRLNCIVTASSADSRDLLEAISRKLWEENHILVGAGRRLMVTAGANMAFLNAILAIADTGDEIILPLPYYFNQEMAIRMLGVPARFRADQ
jgi:aspartate/methionine/tyrosine aminotransferase